MSLTQRELWAVIHGMVLGAAFLLAFAGGFAGLYSLRPEWVTAEGIQERTRRLVWGTWAMALAAWLTVITGTWLVYPWYRAKPPEGVAGEALKEFPRYFLLDNEHLAQWHTFGMEWKEHVAWFAPILATTVAFIVWRYGARLSREPALRRALLVLLTIAFIAAAIAGLYGALITKAAPVA
jgi:hypothetical protein